MRRRLVLVWFLLLTLVGIAWGQGQLIPGDRTLAGRLNAGLTTGTATAYILTLNPAMPAYVADQIFTIRAHVVNTGAATLNVNGLGAKAIKKWVSGALTDLVTGDISVGQEVLLYYDGTVMQALALGQVAGGPGGAVSSVFGRTGSVVASAGDYLASQVTNAADLTAANTFPHATGQTMRQVRLSGATSGALTVKAPGLAGAGVLTLPAGTTDFSTTGGANQVVQQATVGGPFTVGVLSAADLSNGTTGSGTVVLSTAPTLGGPTIGRIANLTTNGYVKAFNNDGTLGMVATVNTGDITGIVPLAQLPTTLSGIRINAREVPYTDAATVQLNTDTTDVAVLTALSQATTFSNPLGTPQPGNQVRLKVTSTVPRAITWGSDFANLFGVPLPTTTTGSNLWDEWGFERVGSAAKWGFVGTTQSSTSARRRTCTILFGADNGPALTNADLVQVKYCEIPSQATVEQITVAANAGTPSVAVHRRTSAGVTTALLTTALATGASGADACARAAAEAGYLATLTCSATLQNTTLSPGMWLGITSGTASGAAWIVVSINYLLQG